MKVTRVKIIKCSGPEYWYKNSIGETFEVYVDGHRGYIVKEDYDLGHRTQWRHLMDDDCEEKQCN